MACLLTVHDDHLTSFLFPFSVGELLAFPEEGFVVDTGPVGQIKQTTPLTSVPAKSSAGTGGGIGAVAFDPFELGLRPAFLPTMGVAGTELSNSSEKVLSTKPSGA